jgi:hypothetical protein
MAARKGKEASVTVSNINTEEDWQELLDKQVYKIAWARFYTLH